MRPPLRLAGLHLLVLWSFAVAQPLFDLLGKNGEFFAARGSTRWDAIVFALVLLFVPPLVLLALEALVPALHPVFVGGLLALFVLQAIRDLAAPGWLLAAVAAALGSAGAVLYVRASGARLALTVLGPAPLLFLALFLFNSDVTRLSLGAENAQAAGAAPRAPVVLVVFDELPLNSLLGADGRIDAARFPSFARLARGSTWFEHATTVAEGTTHAVPAILTGRNPRAGEFPVYTDHRQNLFTLLGGATQLHVADAETHLCPPSLCPNAEGSVGSRARTLAEDTGVVYLHELLPDDLTHGIPSIANGWDDFLQDESGRHDPGRIDAGFVASLRPQPRPSLWYLHLMLPHSPWTYLPSGERYAVRPAPGWGSDEVWSPNQAAVDQYWQRHLLQLGYADTVLGRLLARLRATGLYDRALLVVTADHGVSFRAGQKRRPLSPANLQDIAYVPLFVKTPGQHRARVETQVARTTDVLPTIAAAVRVSIPWHVDGHSLLGPRPAERNVVLIKDGGRRFVVPAATLQRRHEQALRREVGLFGTGGPLSSVFAAGPDRKLLGHPFEGGRRLTGLDPVDRSSAVVQVSGRAPGARSVVVVSGGRVVATMPVAQGRFWALVPAKSLQDGTFEVYARKR
ncbi:MAG TPA: sulfatase-like hydrolase/transferase [Gaiellaceae bacterium]|nr:sulfatase-like hydrolase/transferase [Gaiellaceae bacterium]